MHIVIVDREQATLAPLVDKLKMNDFEITVVENSAGVLSLIAKHSVQFLVADSSLLVGHTLGDAVRKQSPLVRLIVMTVQPTLLGMVEALTSGVTDYFPRRAEYFDQLVATITDERKRFIRWRSVLLGRETFR